MHHLNNTALFIVFILIFAVNNFLNRNKGITFPHEEVISVETMEEGAFLRASARPHVQFLQAPLLPSFEISQSPTGRFDTTNRSSSSNKLSSSIIFAVYLNDDNGSGSNDYYYYNYIIIITL